LEAGFFSLTGSCTNSPKRNLKDGIRHDKPLEELGGVFRRRSDDFGELFRSGNHSVVTTAQQYLRTRTGPAPSLALCRDGITERHLSARVGEAIGDKGYKQS
jgi:hypothetical protein